MNKEIIAVRVDTKISFMDQKRGHLYVPGAEEIRENVYQVDQTVREYGLRQFFTGDRHFADDPELIENDGPFPRHSMDKQYGEVNEDGTYDIDLIKEVVNTNPLVIEHKFAEGDNFRTYTDKELDSVADSSRDVFIEKQSYDFLSNPAAEPLLRKIMERGVRAAIVDGVATEYCDLAAVLGLRKVGFKTYVVGDAISGITPEGAKQALLDMEKAGAEIISVRDIPRIIESYGSAQ